MLLNLLETNKVLLNEKTCDYILSAHLSVFTTVPYWLHGMDHTAEELESTATLCSIYDLHVLNREQLGEL